MRYRWRRFIPKKRPVGLETPAEKRLASMRTLAEANAFVDQLKALPEPHDRESRIRYYRNLVLAQAPRAVLAQWQMDAHKHGYQNRDKRLYELIDFNDSFVSLLLALGHDATQDYVDTLKKEIDDICRQLNEPVFTNEQFDAISRGLGMEIAVYRAARHLGYGVYMTSRTQDAFGIDMVITHPETCQELNIDCKTPSAFRHRLEDLVDRKRISEKQLLKADEDDFITVSHSRGKVKVPVTLLCIRPETLGNVYDFNLTQPERLEDLLNEIFATVKIKAKATAK